MIEINLRKLEKKRVWVKDPSKKGGGYWSHRKVGKGVDSVEKIATLKPLGIKNRLNQYFGIEIVTDYNEKISGMNEKELQNEYNSLEENDDKFLKNFIGLWGRSQVRIDGWVSRLLGLKKETSRQGPDDWAADWEETQEGSENTLMKSIMVNQEFLKRKYPDGFVDLYRAMGKKSYDDAKEKGMKSGNIFSLKSYNTSSWSEYPEFADGYAAFQGRGIVVKVRVPIENILFTTRMAGNNLNSNLQSHWGIKDGREYVVLGGGYHDVRIQSLKEYDHSLSFEEFNGILKKIHKHEGLI